MKIKDQDFEEMFSAYYDACDASLSRHPWRETHEISRRSRLPRDWVFRRLKRMQEKGLMACRSTWGNSYEWMPLTGGASDA